MQNVNLKMENDNEKCKNIVYLSEYVKILHPAFNLQLQLND
jgi:hypothetical protein